MELERQGWRAKEGAETVHWLLVTKVYGKIVVYFPTKCLF